MALANVAREFQSARSRNGSDSTMWAGVLPRVVEIAEVGHLEGAELDAVKVLLVLGERFAVVDLDREFAAGLFTDDGGTPSRCRP